MKHLMTALRVSAFLAAAAGSAAGASAASASPRAVPSTTPQLIVRLYDATGTKPAEVAAAVASADAVIRAAGVDATWIECDAVPRDACEQAMGTSELAIRLVRIAVPGHYDGMLPMGYSLVDTHAHAGALATVYLDRVAWLAAAAEADVPTLLGHAMAHEIGHLLLGTNAHTSGGLMRARWSPQELQRRLPADWQFTRRDIASLRTALAERSKHVAANVVWSTADLNQ